MTSTANEWIVVVLFFMGFIAFTLGETIRLTRRAAVPMRTATAFSAISNFLCITVGFSISFVIFAVILATAWDGSLQDAPGGDASIWAAMAVAVLIPFGLLLLTKRLLIKLFRIEGVPQPWVYSAVSSLMFFLCILVPPALFTFILNRYI